MCYVKARLGNASSSYFMPIVGLCLSFYHDGNRLQCHIGDFRMFIAMLQLGTAADVVDCKANLSNFLFQYMGRTGSQIY